MLHRIAIYAFMAGPVLFLAQSFVRGAEDPCVTPQAVLKGHTEAVYAVTFLPSGNEVLTASFDRTLRLWDVATGKEKQSFGGQSGHQGLVLCVSWRPKSASFASGGLDNSARLWEISPPAAKPDPKAAPKGPVVKSLAHPNFVDSIAFNPEGTLLATGCHDGMVRIWDVAKAQEIKKIQLRVTPPSTAVYTLAWTRDGKVLLSAGLDQRIQAWDVSSGKQVREYKDNRPALPAVLSSVWGSAGGIYGTLPASRLAGQATAAYHLLNEKVINNAHREAVFGLAISPDGKRLASGGSDNLIKLWEVETGRLLGVLVNPALQVKHGEASHPGWIYSLAFTPDGRYLIAGGTAPRMQGYLSVWSANERTLIYSETRPEGSIHGVGISPDGKFVAVACGPRETLAQEAVACILRMSDLMRRQAKGAQK